MKVRDLIEKLGIPSSVTINVNGKSLEQRPFVRINDKNVVFDDNIPDRSRVIIRPANLQDVLEQEFNSKDAEKISVIVNNQIRYFEKTRYIVRLNDRIVDMSELSTHVIEDGDVITAERTEFDHTLEKIMGKPEEGKTTSVLLNGEEVIFNGSQAQITLNGKKAKLSDKVNDGDTVKFKNGEEADPILSDLFEFMDIRKEELVGKSMRLLVNNVPARFTTPLRDGNNVTIEFVEG